MTWICECGHDPCDGLDCGVSLPRPFYCKADGCYQRHYANGYCSPHNARVKRHGDPRAHIPIGGYVR